MSEPAGRFENLYAERADPESMCRGQTSGRKLTKIIPTPIRAWGSFVEKFLAELNDGATRLGGWANAGAFYVAKDFIKSEDWAKPTAIELMDRALRFLVEVDSNGMAIPMFALPRWNELRQA